jgi:hypothetical protein
MQTSLLGETKTYIHPTAKPHIPILSAHSQQEDHLVLLGLEHPLVEMRHPRPMVRTMVDILLGQKGNRIYLRNGDEAGPDQCQVLRVKNESWIKECIGMG